MRKIHIKKVPGKLRCIDEILLTSSDEDFPKKYPNLEELKKIGYNSEIDFSKEVTIKITSNNDSYIAKIYQK